MKAVIIWSLDACVALMFGLIVDRQGGPPWVCAAVTFLSFLLARLVSEIRLLRADLERRGNP